MLSTCRGGCICVRSHQLEGIHLRTQPHELPDLIAARFIFHLGQHRLVPCKVLFSRGVYRFEHGQIEMRLHLSDVREDNKSLIVIYKRVRISDDKVALLPVLLLDNGAMKSIRNTELQ